MLASWITGESELFTFVFASAGFVTGLKISAILARRQYSSRFSPRILKVRGEPES